MVVIGWMTTLEVIAQVVILNMSTDSKPCNLTSLSQKEKQTYGSRREGYIIIDSWIQIQVRWERTRDRTSVNLPLRFKNV